MTEGYARRLGGLLVREFGVMTGRLRRMDGVLLHESAEGEPFPGGILCWYCLSAQERVQLARIVEGADVTVIQTKRETLGRLVLGQALFGALAMRRVYATADLQSLALVTGHEPQLEATLIGLAGAEKLRVEVGSTGAGGSFVYGRERHKAPSRHPPPPAPALLDQLRRALDLGEPVLRARATEAPEYFDALFETPNGLLCVHASARPVSLTLAGLVLFSRLLLTKQRPDAVVRSVSVTPTDDPVVTGFLRQYPGCDALRPDGKPWPAHGEAP